MNKFYLILTTILLCGCHVDFLSLGDSYVLIEDIEIARQHKEGYLEMLIPYQVLNEDYDKSHIIAYQKPDSFLIRSEQIDFYRSIPDSTMRYQHKADSLEVLLDSMLKIRDCYWIIRKKDCKVFGPMTESDFNRECKKRNIKLKMDKRYERQYIRSY
jgi:hypothetical protein